MLNAGHSEKDLDLYFLPLKDKGSTDAKGLVTYLSTNYTDLESIGDGSKYPAAQLPYVAKIKMLTHSSKKRIDVFILGTEVLDLEDCLRLCKGFTVELDASRIVNGPR